MKQDSKSECVLLFVPQFLNEQQINSFCLAVFPRPLKFNIECS
jgi:hypothetical protein